MLSKHKVGDIVTIKERVGNSSDYRFSFVDSMAAKKGQRLKIAKVTESPLCDGKIPDDGYKYELEGSSFNWASSMFEESSDMALQLSIIEALSSYPTSKGSESIDVFIRRKKCPKLDFSL
jgi:hypothetical protein